MKIRVLSGWVVVALVLFVIPAILIAQTPMTIGGHVQSLTGHPIPGATVTASGKGAAPSVTDSAGIFVMTLNVPPSQPVQFRVERTSYESLVETKAVAPGLPVDFTLRSSRKITTKETMSSLGTGLRMADETIRQLDCANVPCPSSPRTFRIQIHEEVNVNDKTEDLVFRDEKLPVTDKNSIWGVISTSQISRLDDQDKVLVMVYSDAVATNYDDWSRLSLQLQNPALPPDIKKVTATQLISAGKNLCGNFHGLLAVLQGIDVRVWDHYLSVEDVCHQFAASHVGDHP